MKVLPTSLLEVRIIEPDVFADNRGFLMEIYQEERYRGEGLGAPVVQVNHSHSVRRTLRGLHYQLRRPQGKLIQVVRGTIFDVAVDIRQGSPTFGRWTGVELSGENRRQLFVPGGFAHGFYVLSDTADVIYGCTALYDPQDEGGILWSDPVLGIGWPVSDPIVSPKDGRLPGLREVPWERLPLYEAKR
ncbi:MAG: dTDP-4-dehydrorhamnose 3,5-epimerase [Nitrospirota bacterium]